MKITKQISMAETFDQYGAFVEKFKPKKTTDDCYTPANIYEVVLDWVVAEYGINKEKVIRPFWPGADYREMDYPEGWTVVDNPPFSIIAQICKDYLAAGIPFFLFAPYLTNFNISGADLCHVITDAQIEYENGAEVNTSFITNLQAGCVVRTAPKLREAIRLENKKNTQKGPKQDRFEYPAEVLTVAMVGKMARWGVDFSLDRSEVYHIRELESQKAVGKGVFGSGFLLSQQATEKKLEALAEAETWAEKDREADATWHLSDVERRIIKELSTCEYYAKLP